MSEPTEYKPVVNMTNWVLHERGFGHYLRPYRHLQGDVLDHPRLGAMDNVFTSEVLSYDEELGIVVTRNTIYQLASPERVVRQSFEAE